MMVTEITRGPGPWGHSFPISRSHTPCHRTVSEYWGHINPGSFKSHLSRNYETTQIQDHWSHMCLKSLRSHRSISLKTHSSKVPEVKHAPECKIKQIQGYWGHTGSESLRLPSSIQSTHRTMCLMSLKSHRTSIPEFRMVHLPWGHQGTGTHMADYKWCIGPLISGYTQVPGYWFHSIEHLWGHTFLGPKVLPYRIPLEIQV